MMMLREKGLSQELRRLSICPLSPPLKPKQQNEHQQSHYRPATQKSVSNEKDTMPH